MKRKKKLQRHLTPSNPHYKVVAENLHPIKEISTGIDLGNMSDCMHTHLFSVLFASLLLLLLLLLFHRVAFAI